MNLSHFVIIMDEFLLVPNICPSSGIFLCNNLTYQICDTLWPSHIQNSVIYMDYNMKLSHFTIIMDEFLLVPNICLSSIVFFAQQFNLPNLRYTLTLWPSHIHKIGIDMDWQYEAESLCNHHG